MIGEKEFYDILMLPIIQSIGAKARPFSKHEVRVPPITTNQANGRSERAIAIWIAAQTKVFLKAQGAASNPMVERVWKFADGNADIDIRVGIRGGYRKFKLTTRMTGPTSFQLKILTWDAHGKDVCEFERFGAYRGNAEGEGIETLPVN